MRGSVVAPSSLGQLASPLRRAAPRGSHRLVSTSALAVAAGGGDAASSAHSSPSVADKERYHTAVIGKAGSVSPPDVHVGGPSVTGSWLTTSAMPTAAVGSSLSSYGDKDEVIAASSTAAASRRFGVAAAAAADTSTWRANGVQPSPIRTRHVGPSSRGLQTRSRLPALHPRSAQYVDDRATASLSRDREAIGGGDGGGGADLVSDFSGGGSSGEIGGGGGRGGGRGGGDGVLEPRTPGMAVVSLSGSDPHAGAELGPPVLFRSFPRPWVRAGPAQRVK